MAVTSRMGRNLLANGCFRIPGLQASGTALAAGAAGHAGWVAGAGGCTYTFSGSPDVTVAISAGSLLTVVPGASVTSAMMWLGFVGNGWARAYQGAAPAAGVGYNPVGDNGALLVPGLTLGQPLTVELSTTNPSASSPAAGSFRLVQLEASLFGASPSLFERRPLAIDLLLCERTVSSPGATFTMQPCDKVLLISAAPTAPIVVALPPAASLPAGTSRRIVDVAGGVSTANTLTVASPGSDTLNGGSTSVFTAAFTDFQVTTDGVSAWTFDVQGLARGGTGARDAATAATNLGLGTASAPSFGGLTRVGTSATRNLAVDSSGRLVQIFNDNSSPAFATYQNAGVNGVNQGGYIASVSLGGATSLAPSGAIALFSGPGSDFSTSAKRNSVWNMRCEVAGTLATALILDPVNGNKINGSLAPFGSGASLGTAAVPWQFLFAGTVVASTAIRSPSYTVATLPAAGTAGTQVFASNARVFNGTGTLEAAGAGTGGLVTDNGSAWKIAGTNVTASA